MRYISDKNCRGNQNTYFMFNNFFPGNRTVYEIMWKKYCIAEQATDTAHAHCTLANSGYRHTLRMCNAYCFTTATMVTRTRLFVTFILTL